MGKGDKLISDEEKMWMKKRNRQKAEMIRLRPYRAKFTEFYSVWGYDPNTISFDLSSEKMKHMGAILDEIFGNTPSDIDEKKLKERCNDNE